MVCEIIHTYMVVPLSSLYGYLAILVLMTTKNIRDGWLTIFGEQSGVTEGAIFTWPVHDTQSYQTKLYANW